ncbi:hypothetical protein L3X38_018798 [Prunus dulcis]|uniref:Uncharacterized protein n=1 Tax=Prunus dulcis TaxID=3755 RepID=A0AAD4WCA4_PRUDU|nr:hypothetical protein L3X38_018798 [Prunus dulcis]
MMLYRLIAQHSRRLLVCPRTGLFLGRLATYQSNKSTRHIGPFRVLQVYLYGAVEIQNLETGATFKVNGQRLMPYVEVNFDAMKSTLPLTNPA